MQRILITGSRGWLWPETIQLAIALWVKENVPRNEASTLVHGDCPHGADRMARDFARQVWWLEEEAHPAQWDTYGRRAGFVRNEEMVLAGADVCLAFILNGSKGAKMTADIAEKAGIPTIRYEVNTR